MKKIPNGEFVELQWVERDKSVGLKLVMKGVPTNCEVRELGE